jgi:uncharacterized membrane protein (UPF0127 family)
MSRHRRSRLYLLLAMLLVTATVRAANLAVAHVKIVGHRISVEIANTDATREHGLMGRMYMAPNHGMLFVYPDAQPRYFWMKHTLIPLDILFFDAQRRLINVSADAPPCEADPCPTYNSAAPAQYVLELNAGAVKRLGIEAGQQLKLN